MYYLRKKQMDAKENRGQSLVEFALALPVFLMIVFGIIEFGMLIFSVAVVNGSAREGARYGAAKGVNNQYYNCSGIESAVMGTGSLIGITAVDVNITYDDGTGTIHGFDCPTLASFGGSKIEAGDRVIVEVAYTYQSLMKNILAIPVPDMNLGSTVRRLIMKDLVIEGAAGSSNLPASTPTSTPATTCEAVLLEELDPFSFDDDSKSMEFYVSNNSAALLEISQITVDWPNSNSDNGSLYAIRLKGALDLPIFINGASNSPLTIPDQSSWNIHSNATWRQIPANSVSQVWWLFSHGAESSADDDYFITIVFDILTGSEAGTQCTKTTSYDVN